MPFRFIILLVLLILPLPSHAQELRDRLLAKWDEAKPAENAKLALVVQDVRTGQVLADVSPSTSMAPASLVKLFTAAAALDVLGPSHRFETRLSLYGDRGPYGVFTGDAVIHGGGDPAFGPRFQVDRTALTEMFHRWALELRTRGLTRIEGAVIGDATMFAGPSRAMGWEEPDFAEWYAAPVSSLTFNDGCVDVAWKVGKKHDSLPTFTIAPPCGDTASVSSLVRISNAAAAPDVTFFYDPARGEAIARGDIPPGVSYTASSAVKEPAIFTATVFTKVLESDELPVARFPAAWLPGDTEARDALTTPLLTLSHLSPPLSEYLSPILADSHNLYAETLARHVALAKGAEPSFDGAAAILVSWAEEHGLADSAMLLVDASGLSTVDRLSASSVAKLLDNQLGAGVNGMLFRDALARAGETGSLRNRLPALRGRFSAKTGTRTGVHSVAGYLRTADYREYIVVLIINAPDMPRDQARALIDAMVMEVDSTVGDGT